MTTIPWGRTSRSPLCSRLPVHPAHLSIQAGDRLAGRAPHDSLRRAQQIKDGGREVAAAVRGQQLVEDPHASRLVDPQGEKLLRGGLDGDISSLLIRIRWRQVASGCPISAA
jgi:hypothetical protein